MMDWDPIGTTALDVSHGNGHRPSRASDEVTIPPGSRREDQAAPGLCLCCGEDPERSGLRGTPQRMARMYGELLAGYETDIETLVNGALFDVDYSEMVVVKDIEYYSLCEHHLLPFFGKAHVAYIPRDRVIGLSKIPRIVEMYARRLQVQERLTQQIATQLDDVLHPQGVAVVMEGTHLCAAMRGVEQRSARMRTSAMLGCFQKNAALRAEFLQQIGPEPAH